MAACRDCEHWYPYFHNAGNTGMCAANYKHEQPASMWTCRDFEQRTGYTYYVDKEGKKDSDIIKLQCTYARLL